MRLRLLKLACLVLVLALAGGLIVFNFAGDDLQSAFIETSSVTPAATGAPAPAMNAGAGGAADQNAAAGPDTVPTSAPLAGPGAAFAPIAPGAAEPAPAAGDGSVAAVSAQTPTTPSPDAAPAPVGAAAQAPTPDANATPSTRSIEATTAAPTSSTAAPSAAGVPTPDANATPSTPSVTATTAAPTSLTSALSAAAAPVGAASATAATASAPAEAAAPPAPDSAAGTAASENSYAAVVWPEGQPAQASDSEAAAAPKPQPQPEKSAAAPAPAVIHHRVAKRHAVASAPEAQTVEKKPTTGAESNAAPAASAEPATAPAPRPPPQTFVAQVAPSNPPARAPLAPAPPPRGGSDPAARLAFGLQTLIEFPSLQSNASGSLAGSGSVTNSSARVIPGVIGSWTSAPLADLPLKPSFGGSLFIGAPASGNSVASATTSGGYTLKLGQSNDWPVVMPRVFMGLPVAEGTRASFGTGIWVNNVKETATLANASGSQSDEHTGVMMRPFLSAAIEQRAPLLGFLPSESQRLKVSGGYVFGDSTFSAAFCAAGQTCVRTQDQGSWFLGLSFQMGFPAGGAPAP
jgi:hypothetical protein